MTARVAEAAESSILERLHARYGPRGAMAWLRERYPPESLVSIPYEWRFVGRETQQTPSGDDWDTWLVLAGRGWGKTRAGVEFVNDEVKACRMRRIALVAATAADTRDVMVEGESGFLAKSPPWFRPKYEPSKRRLTWPNGAVATLYSAEEPDRLRGPQHDGFWADELAAWQDPRETWDMLQFGLRLGTRPRGIITTTPRPIGMLKELIRNPRVVMTRGSTYANASNLAPAFLDAIRRAYEGTRLGRQEIGAEILDDNPNALWKQPQIDADRVKQAPPLKRVVVAVDPATTSNPNSSETGIVVVGRGACGCTRDGKAADHAFTLADYSGIYDPAEWAEKVIVAYETHDADAIVCEVNNGGDLVEQNIRNHPRGKYVKIKQVRATRGKEKRAEPVAAMAERHEDHHVGTYPKLEDQQTQWDPLDPNAVSPDRMDAKVWAIHELFLSGTVDAQYRPATGPIAPSRHRR